MRSNFNLMEMSPVWNVVFIGAFAQGIFVAIILLVQYFKTKEKSSLYLGLFVFTFSYVLLNNIVYWNGLYMEFPHFLFSTYSIRYLVAPFFLFYVLAFLYGKNAKIHLYHLIPFAFLFIIYSPLIILSGEDKIAHITPPFEQSYYNLILYYIGNYAFKLFSVHLLLYSYLVFRCINRYLKNNFGQLEKHKLNQIGWLKFLNFLFFIYGLMMLIYFTLIALGVGGIEKDYIISLVISIAVYCIST